MEKLEEDAVEFQKPKMPSAVYSPSKAEMEEHIMTACATYRSWCPHCVASQSKGNPHKVSGEASEIPTLAFDYGYMSKEKGAIPMIVGRDSKSGSHAAMFLSQKGRDAYAVSYLVAWVKGLGYRKVIFKSERQKFPQWAFKLKPAVGSQSPDLLEAMERTKRNETRTHYRLSE